ncbi:hypothetical protein [Nocardioides panacisoli]|uniref:hypothetical protein n=1 Tax=Nocardioides panacisoli TaxID=627624 RepID=UPI0031E4431C
MLTHARQRDRRTPTRVRFNPHWPDVDRLIFDMALAAARPGDTIVLNVGRHHVLLLDHLWLDLMPLSPGIRDAIARGVHVLFVGQPETCATWWRSFYDLKAHDAT